MHAMVRSDIQSNREPVSRSHRRIAWIGCDIQLPGRNLCAGNRARFVADPHQDARNSISLNVEILEVPRGHASLPIEDKGAGECDADHLSPGRING